MMRLFCLFFERVHNKGFHLKDHNKLTETSSKRKLHKLQSRYTYGDKNYKVD